MSVARLSATAVLLAVCAGLGAPAAVADVADVKISASAPRLLSASDLPAKPQFSRLTESPVIKGLRSQDYCELQALPRKKTVHRSFYNDQIGRYVFQYAVRPPSGKEAKAVAADLRSASRRPGSTRSPSPTGSARCGTSATASSAPAAS